ncbi:hypothetical protein HDU87_004179 [Geranomyces variabilis]|uniref:Uncharacterized protein n=1 Tax=Geranomyces variabilis TaxID=109894 RepID=A0AAD5TL79_9FUNG|nr:hypothetical protein HDU87_004179 [Geranomyces variabilis]
MTAPCLARSPAGAAVLPTPPSVRCTQRRGVCAATAFQPVFYRDAVRVPIPRRSFPLWRHKEVVQTIRAADPATAERIRAQRALAAKRKLEASRKRLPGWEKLLRALEDDLVGPNEARAAHLERQKRREERLRRRGYRPQYEVLAPTATMLSELQAADADMQRQIVHSMYKLTVEQAGRYDLAQDVLNQYAGDARQMFDQHGNSRARALQANPFNALMYSHSKRGDQTKCQAVLQQMAGAGVRPTYRTYGILIAACTVDQVDTAIQILDLMITSNMRPSLCLFNKVLDLTFSAGEEYRKQAATVFGQLLRIYRACGGARSGPNSTTVGILLRQCKQDEDIESLFKDIQAWSLVRSSRVQEELLRTVLRIRAPPQQLPGCLDWANRFAALGVPLSPEATNVVLQAYTTSGNLAKGLDFVERVQRDSGQQHHSDGLRSLLKSIGRGNVDKTEDEIAWRIWKRLLERSEAPNRRTFVELVDAMGRAGDTKGLWYLHRLMMAKSRGAADVAPVAETDAARNSGDHEAAKALFARIDPTDQSLHRAFVRAFGTRRAADPASAAAAFAHGSNDERTAMDLLGSIRSRRQAAPLLNALLAVAVARHTPLSKESLGQAFTAVLDRAAREDGEAHSPMAFSSAQGLDRLGAWDLSALGPRPAKQVSVAREAVVKAAAQGVASAAASVREGEDIDLAVDALDSWLRTGTSPKPQGGSGVEGALKDLESLSVSSD